MLKLNSFKWLPDILECLGQPIYRSPVFGTPTSHGVYTCVNIHTEVTVGVCSF